MDFFGGCRSAALVGEMIADEPPEWIGVIPEFCCEEEPGTKPVFV
jgi:hypothetical protein